MKPVDEATEKQAHEAAEELHALAVELHAQADSAERASQMLSRISRSDPTASEEAIEGLRAIMSSSAINGWYDISGPVADAITQLREDL